MERICTQKTGLFPAPKEIQFRCSCPDWAAMCKHVAAVLYGVGARLDVQPELIFLLRRVDAKDLISQAEVGHAKSKPRARDKVLDDSQLADVFGIELDGGGRKTVTARARPVAAKLAQPVRRPDPRKSAKPTKVTKVTKKKAATRTASKPVVMTVRKKSTRGTAAPAKPATKSKRTASR